jgi:hypothetical protein
LKHTGFPFEDWCWPGQSGARQPDGEHGIAPRFGDRDPFPLRRDGAVFAQNADGAGFVEPHQPRIAYYVSGHYRRQPASDPAQVLSHTDK